MIVIAVLVSLIVFELRLRILLGWFPTVQKATEVVLRPSNATK